MVAECDGPRDLTYAADPQHVSQILVNLLSNAIKFTDAGGRVSLACALREGVLPHVDSAGVWACLDVTDTGTGIPSEQAGRIFDPFVQGESGYTRRHGGAGLGLAISLRLARSMGGDLSVSSAVGRAWPATSRPPTRENPSGLRSGAFTDTPIRRVSQVTRPFSSFAQTSTGRRCSAA